MTTSNNNQTNIYLHENGNYGTQGYFEQKIINNWNDNINNIQNKMSFENYRLAYFGYLTHISDINAIPLYKINTINDIDE